MFKGLGGIGAMASLFKQAQTIGPKMQAAMEELKTKQVVGEAGGGLVKVFANGLGQVVSVQFDPLLEEQNDWEMVRDLLPAAVNEASARAKELHIEAMQEATGDLPLPENMEGMLKGLFGNS
jgi:DNA-binding YbaB/EbfC family protein